MIANAYILLPLAEKAHELSMPHGGDGQSGAEKIAKGEHHHGGKPVKAACGYP